MERELAVLQLLARGNSNQKISAALSVSEGTVKFHINHILHKLGVSDRIQATIAALKQGSSSSRVAGLAITPSQKLSKCLNKSQNLRLPFGELKVWI